MRQSVIILAMTALVVSGCAGGGGTSATSTLTPQSAAVQPLSAARAQIGAHRDAECDDRDSRKHDGRDSRARDRRNDRDDRDRDDRDAREHDGDECSPSPSPSPTPVPTPRPPGPLSLTCDASAVLGTAANCALSNPSFTGSVGLSYSGTSACTGPAAAVVPLGMSVQFQVNASSGGGCHVAAQVGQQQAAADITFTR